MEVEKITIKAFKAVDDPAACEEYVREHVKVLEDIGVFTALKPDLSWIEDPNVIVITAHHEVLGLVAGIRVHVASFGNELPMQKHLSKLDNRISAYLGDLLPNGNGEICGLWNAHRFAGRGVPMLLMETAVAIANQVGLTSMVTFIAEYVAPYAAQSGFKLMDRLQNGGVFIYPIPSIKSHAMVLDDALSMCSADPLHRQRILSLRLRPHQKRSERPKGASLQVDYELLDKAPSTDEVAGRKVQAA
jgi:hypothetical protein